MKPVELLNNRPLHHGKFCSHLPSLKQYIIIVNVHVLSTNSVEAKFFGLQFFKKTESFLALFAKLCFLLLTIRVNGMIEPRYLPSNPLLDLRSTYASQLPSYSQQKKSDLIVNFQTLFLIVKFFSESSTQKYPSKTTFVIKHKK